MSSTNFTIGFGASSKPSSKVLRPPGGGSSDIFGNDMPATPRSAKNHMASNIFGSEQNSSVKANGDARRNQKNGDSYSRLFGEPERPFTPAKNHMRSSIPIGGGSPTKNGNGNISSSSSTNGHQNYQNGNGKMENGTTSSASSEYQNGVSKTENLEENANNSQKLAQAPTNNSVENSNENNNIQNNSNNNYNSNEKPNTENNNNNNNEHSRSGSFNNYEYVVNNNSTDNNHNNNNNNLSTNLPPPSQNNDNNNDDTKSILTHRSQMPDDHNYDGNTDENNDLKIIPEFDNDQMNIINNRNNDTRTSPAAPAITYPTDDVNINKNNNNYSSSHNANPATTTNESSPHVNHNNNNNMQNGDHYTTTRSGVNRSKKHNEFSSPRRDENGRPIDSNGAQLPISHRLTNMNNPNRSPRSYNSRNPVTGLGVERSNYKPRKWADHKDGNPVTGEGYKPAGGEINTTIPCLNGANQVINKNRIPPGGFSSGLW